MSLESKIQRAKDGDGESFYELIEERQNSLYKIAFAYVKNKEDALDVVSETVYKAFMNIDKLKDAGLFYTWLTRILINTAINYVKKNNKTIPLDEDMERHLYTYEKDSDILIDLYNAMDRLSDKYKTVIILKFFQDLTLAEISKILSCPIGTVKSNIHRALKELKFELREGMLDEQ